MQKADAGGGGRFSLAHLLLLIPWVALVIDAWSPISDNSFLWHIRAGTVQAAEGSVLTTDPFSFTAGGHPWLTQSWLAELLYARLEDWGGLAFVPPLLLVLTALTFFGIALIAYRASGSVLATALVLLLTTVSLISFLVPRPVIFSYLLFVLVILAWERPNTRWILPFLFWFWASMHGSFFIGLGYVGLRLLSKKEWRALPFPIAAGLATLLTAHGLGVVRILLDFVAARPYLSLLTEWRTPELLSPVFFPVFLGLGLILYGATRQRINAPDLIVILPFVALALTALRSVPPAWIGLIIPVSLGMSGWGSGLPRRFGKVPTAVFVAVVAVLPFLLADGGGLAEGRFPEALAGELGPEPIFHDDVVGGYLIYRAGPELQVFIDDRAELYQEGIKEFVEVRNGRQPWEPVFEEYEISQVLLRDEEPMVGWLEEAGWTIRSTEDGFVLLGN